jgi:serine/threonine protein kinase
VKDTSLPASRIAHYELIEKLGEGGMGVVYKARDMRLGRVVALKILPVDRTADKERRRRFLVEAQAASALNHPNIVGLLDIGSEDGADYLTMEYVEGRTLADVIGRKGLKVDELLRYGESIADALTAAHQAGIIHCDLKPTNIRVTRSGSIKLVDFGLARLTEQQSKDNQTTQTLCGDAVSKTDEGAIVGTVAYMSPEQAESRPVDARSDIFSLGAVLYEMATGRRAFTGDTRLSVLSAILRDEPKPLSEIAPQIPREIERVIQRCLRKDSNRRFQHMDEARVVLRELREESDSGKLTTAGIPSRPWQMDAAGSSSAQLRSSCWQRQASSSSRKREQGLTNPIFRMTGIGLCSF